MQRLLNRLLPFLLIGMVVVMLTFGMLLFAYLFLFGAIVGGILFIIAWLKQKLFPSKKITPFNKKSGRIIDTDDWKKL